ncbi:MAG: OmpH family outer membrane protein [Pseudomonadota bacterium]
MRNFSVLNPSLVIVALVALLAGCDASLNSDKGTASNRYDVAVIDLDKVVNDSALRKKIEDAVTQRQSTLQLQLDQIQQSLQSQYDARRAEFSDQPTDEQNQVLQNLMANLNQEFDTNREKLNTDLAEFRQQQNEKTVGEIRPVAQAVAADIGAKIILHRNNNALFSANASVDITDQVTKIINGN